MSVRRYIIESIFIVVVVLFLEGCTIDGCWCTEDGYVMDSYLCDRNRAMLGLPPTHGRCPPKRYDSGSSNRSDAQEPAPWYGPVGCWNRDKQFDTESAVRETVRQPGVGPVLSPDHWAAERMPEPNVRYDVDVCGLGCFEECTEHIGWIFGDYLPEPMWNGPDEFVSRTEYECFVPAYRDTPTEEDMLAEFGGRIVGCVDAIGITYTSTGSGPFDFLVSIDQPNPPFSSDEKVRQANLWAAFYQCLAINCSEMATWQGIDSDGDGVDDDCDNCPAIGNAGQSDRDEDGFGDSCDNCPEQANPGQQDVDGDGQGEACDECPQDPRNSITDHDGDGHPKCRDNCPTVFNPDQADFDRDGVGDACPIDTTVHGIRVAFHEVFFGPDSPIRDLGDDRITPFSITHVNLGWMGRALQSPDTPNDVYCCVDFERAGDLVQFSNPRPDIDLEVIDSVEKLRGLANVGFAGIYVVRELTYCSGRGAQGTIRGCQVNAPDGTPIAIVLQWDSTADTWLHEFGHLQGLDHTPQDRRRAVMRSASDLTPDEVERRTEVNAAECAVYRAFRPPAAAPNSLSRSENRTCVP